MSMYPTTLPLLSLSHPSGLSQCTGFEYPVLCIKLGLVICFTYGNIHVSMLFTQIIPPSPSPTESKVCSLYLCFFCYLHIRSSLPSFWILCICANILYLCVSFWLTLLCIMGSSFIPSLELTQMCSFEWLSNIPVCTCATAFLSIHLLMGI